MEEILIAYLQEQPAAAPQREGRISICAGKEEPDFYLIKEGDMLWKSQKNFWGMHLPGKNSMNGTKKLSRIQT